MCGCSGRRFMVSFGVWWCLFVSYVVWRCEEGVSGVSQRVSECCLWICVRFGASECANACLGLVWWSKCSILEKLQKGKIPHTWHFWNIKISKPPNISSLKSLGYSTFWNFWACQKQITCNSLFGSPCIFIRNVTFIIIITLSMQPWVGKKAESVRLTITGYLHSVAHASPPNNIFSWQCRTVF